MEKTTDFMELLIQAIAARVKESLMEDISNTISVNMPAMHADNIEGLEEMIANAMNEHDRNFSIEADDITGLERFIDSAIDDAKIKADNVEDLDGYIKAVLNEATVSFDF